MSWEIALWKFIKEFFWYTLWQYRLNPTHDWFSHKAAWLLWWLYGVYSYLIYLLLKNKKWFHYNKIKQWLTTAIDWILLEIVCNIVFIYFTKDYLFYYYPNDLNHYSTLFVFPLYFIVGLIIFKLTNVFITNKNLKIIDNIELWIFFIAMGLILSVY